jgi:hypothetical protein
MKRKKVELKRKDPKAAKQKSLKKRFAKASNTSFGASFIRGQIITNDYLNSPKKINEDSSIVKIGENPIKVNQSKFKAANKVNVRLNNFVDVKISAKPAQNPNGIVNK